MNNLVLVKKDYGGTVLKKFQNESLVKCLNSDPRRRYTDCAEALEDFKIHGIKVYKK